MCLDRSFLVCLFLLAVLACSSCFAVHCLQFFDLPGLWVDAFSCLQFIACSSLTFQVCELMCLSVWGSFCPLSHHILLPYQLCKSCQLSELLFSLAAGSLDYLDIFFDFQYHLRFLHQVFAHFLRKNICLILKSAFEGFISYFLSWPPPWEGICLGQNGCPYASWVFLSAFLTWLQTCTFSEDPWGRIGR